jgi:hypothetical protein
VRLKPVVRLVYQLREASCSYWTTFGEKVALASEPDIHSFASTVSVALGSVAGSQILHLLAF